MKLNDRAAEFLGGVFAGSLGLSILSCVILFCLVVIGVVPALKWIFVGFFPLAIAGLMITAILACMMIKFGFEMIFNKEHNE